MNRLYFGDNLDILREHIRDESVDLVYLDPPFNSSATYNVLFKSPKGQQSHAQIAAFEDTWHWGEQAEREFAELLHGKNTDVAEMMQALRKFLGENDMMAYLTMMANRLVELHRVLKETGSLYLHCDPTASHYLKIVLDGVFTPENYRNEIIWKRTHAHGSAQRWGDVHDTIFFYSKGEKVTWNRVLQPYDESYVEDKYRWKDARGSYQEITLTAPGTTQGDSGKPWGGYDPTAAGRHWAVPQRALEELREAGVTIPTSLHAQLDVLAEQGYIVIPKKRDGSHGVPRFKLHLGKGTPAQDVITDISPINSQAQERLGYPTQKPLALLERIIETSSNEGDTVLDPFCGCGTAIHAAQKLKREWIGIDITHLAIALVEKRLRDAFPSLKFEVHGTPKDLGGASDLASRDKYEFQYWACSLVNAQPYQHKKKGADSGIDGLIYFQVDTQAPKKVIVSVKGGGNVSVQMVRDLRGVIEREKAALGLFVTLAPATKPMKEEAVKAGYYAAPSGTNFPKLQILTIEGLLSGNERARYPDLAAGGHTFKKAVVEQGKVDQGQLFK